MSISLNLVGGTKVRFSSGSAEDREVRRFELESLSDLVQLLQELLASGLQKESLIGGSVLGRLLIASDATAAAADGDDDDASAFQ